MRTRRSARTIALAAAFLAGATTLANAEMFRCVAPDGSVTFTDNAAACPRAQKHEAEDRIQRVSPGVEAVGPAAMRRADSPSKVELDLEAEEAQKQVWQQKKREAEARLRDLEAREARLRRLVVGCNRGAEIITRDVTGLKYEVPCDEVRSEHRATELEAEQLRDYLDSGLRRECRRAGCLPGWIR
jgi:hypothetical protein